MWLQAFLKVVISLYFGNRMGQSNGELLRPFHGIIFQNLSFDIFLSQTPTNGKKSKP
jgi:hypothetical protein